jgi:hypothetical protein
MLRIQVIGLVRVRVLEVGDDGETPIALAQPEVIADRIAERAGAVQVPESLLDFRDLCGILPCLQPDENDIPDHDRILAAETAVTWRTPARQPGTGEYLRTGSHDKTLCPGRGA